MQMNRFIKLLRRVWSKIELVCSTVLTVETELEKEKKKKKKKKIHFLYYYRNLMSILDELELFARIIYIIILNDSVGVMWEAVGDGP